MSWKHLHSSDPRKKPAQEALRAAAGNPPGRGRVTIVMIEGSRVRGYVHRVAPGLIPACFEAALSEPAVGSASPPDLPSPRQPAHRTPDTAEPSAR